MIFLFTYEQDYQRVIFGVNVDARASIPAISNKVGAVIKAYNDAQIATVDKYTLIYRIHTNEGNMVGYIGIKVDPVKLTGSIVMKQYRPNFYQFMADLDIQVDAFLAGDTWQNDYLDF